MYVGFSTGIQKLESNHYILAWSFMMDGKAPELDLSRRPSIPQDCTPLWKSFKLFLFIFAALVDLLFLINMVGISYLTKRKRKLMSENIEGWEMDSPHRLPYRKIYRATKGCREEMGKGGFGSVYKGVLPISRIEVAVKRVSHGSKQGMREFVAEVSSLGRTRHRNLIQLHGWCRRGNDLLLVYEFILNGSLDCHLFEMEGSRLSWAQRLKIRKVIACGLLYLHEEWEQVIMHRDVKASNILLDGDLNGKLGDFGLAKLYDHGTNPKNTHVVGSLGYMASELSRTSKSKMSSDVYSYGSLLLEVACGRRLIEPRRPSEEMILVELVHSLWKGGRVLDARDKRLGTSYVEEKVEQWCSDMVAGVTAPESRPNMRQLTQSLNGKLSLIRKGIVNLRKLRPIQEGVICSRKGNTGM
ncbi:L-type lectin-domain containing receptor kinase IV.1-like [Nymphaea colorata]|nr:L-type lectin-domain containing receptor kinase IV.1-like [Nymphaea colorata]